MRTRHNFYTLQNPANDGAGSAATGTGGTSGQAADGQTAGGQAAAGYPADYVRELRAEAAANRVKAKEAEERAAAAAADAAAKVEALQKQVEQTTKAAEQRAIRAELRALALASGIVDADALALADISAVKFDPETGDVTGAAEAVAALKTAKPYLFAASTSSTATAPAAKKSEKPAGVRAMSDAEYAIERKKLGLR